MTWDCNDIKAEWWNAEIEGYFKFTKSLNLMSPVFSTIHWYHDRRKGGGRQMREEDRNRGKRNDKKTTLKCNDSKGLYETEEFMKGGNRVKWKRSKG